MKSNYVRPIYQKIREPIKPYFPFAAELRVVDGLLFPGNTNC